MKLEPTKYTLGISAGFHDAAATVIDSRGDIVFAGHSERYSKRKNDSNIHLTMLNEFCEYNIDTIAYYERPMIKQLRRLRSGEGFDFGNLTTRQILKQQLGSWLQYLPQHIKSYNHHLSHAAAGFQTSPYNKATVVVIDAIGEFDTVSIYAAHYDETGHAQYHPLWKQKYPRSIGLFYSAVTARIGLHPLDEEYITMGMAAWGKPQYVEELRLLLNENLHIGIDPEFLSEASN
jgi:carbamoyltransferase